MYMYRASLALSFLAAFVFCHVAGAPQSQSPDLSVRLTERGLKYVAKDVVRPAILLLAGKIVLPKSFPIAVSGFTLRLDNATMTGLNVHVPTIVPVSSPSSLQVTLTADVSGFTYYYAHSLLLDDQGLINFTFTGVTVTVAVDLVPGGNGTWKLVLVKSESTIANVKLDFVRTTHRIIIGLLKGALVSAVKKQVQKTVEMLLPKAVMTANKELALHLPYVHFAYGFGADLALMEKGIFVNNCFANIRIVGLVTYDKRPYGTATGFNVSEPSCNGSMASAVVSESVAQSLLLAASQPEDKFKHFVNTSVLASESMLAIVFPEIAKHHLVGTLSANVSLVKGDVSFSSNLAQFALTGEVDLFAHDAHKKPVVVAQLQMAFRVGADVYIRNLAAPVNRSTQAFAVKSVSISPESLVAYNSTVGPVKTTLILEILKAAIIQHMAEINALGEKGVLVPPTPFGAPIVDIKLQPGYVQLFGDMATQAEPSEQASEVDDVLQLDELMVVVNKIISDSLQQLVSEHVKASAVHTPQDVV